MVKLKPFLLAILMLFSGGLVVSRPAYATLDGATMDFFNQNGIYYYDPTGGDNCVTNTDGGNVTIIGDSITVGAEQAIKSLIPKADIYAQVSKTFGNPDDEAIDPVNAAGNPSGISIAKYLLATGKLRTTLVFALGTNNAPLTQASVTALLDMLDQKYSIYFLTNYDSTGRLSSYFTTNNALFESAAQDGRVHVVPWAAEAAADPTKYIAPDGIHPTADGQNLFAELIDKAVGGSTSVTAGSNGNYTNYAGDQVLTDTQIQQVEANMPIYQQAIDETGAASHGMTWQFLAAIHYKETGLARYNPGNGQGVWQLYDLYQRGVSFPPADTISEAEFLRQTKLAITEELIGKVESMNLDLSNENDIKKFFFAYNGMAGVYKQKALDMGFTQEEANNGEGSPYVMNGYDAPRDPFHLETMDPKWRGAFVADGVYDSNALTYNYGAFVIYSALGGATVCGGPISGGLSLEQARIFMNDYINNVTCSDWPNVYCTHSSSYGAKANCVTFVQYFISRFTTAEGVSSTGNGGWVVSNLTGTDVQSPFGSYNNSADYSSQGFAYGGFEPRPYAIFSTGHGVTMCGSVKCGHTGVVLGIDEAGGKIYIGQAGYNTPLVGYSDVIEYDLSKYTSGEYWFAYTDSIINTAAIAEVVGN